MKELQSTSTKDKLKNYNLNYKRNWEKYNYYCITNWTCCSKSPPLGMDKKLLFIHKFYITNNKLRFKISSWRSKISSWRSKISSPNYYNLDLKINSNLIPNPFLIFMLFRMPLKSNSNLEMWVTITWSKLILSDS